MIANPDSDEDYDLTQTDRMDTDEMIEEMELSIGDTVVADDDPAPSDVMQVDSIDLGYVKFHYPHVTHPQDGRYGGRGAFDQPVEEWYTDWKQGVLRPASVEVNAE